MFEYYCPVCRRTVRTLSGTGWLHGRAQPRCPQCGAYVADPPLEAEPKTTRLPKTWDDLAFQAGVPLETLKARAASEGIDGAKGVSGTDTVPAGTVASARVWFRATWIDGLEWD